MTPADIILVFVIILSIGGVVYYHFNDKKMENTQHINAE